jgi:hypothetical protein
MKLEELITDMKAAGCNDNTMQLARNFYLCGQKDEREACARFFDLNDTNIFWGSQVATHIRARGQHEGR